MRDVTMNVEEARHLFIHHVDSSSVGKLVRENNRFTATKSRLNEMLDLMEVRAQGEGGSDLLPTGAVCFGENCGHVPS